MSELGPQVVADLVADDGNVAAGGAGARQQRLGTRQRLEPFEMDAVKGFVEYPLRLACAVSKQRRKEIAQGAVRAITHFLQRPRRLSQRQASVAVAFDDGRPSVDQRVVPVEQDRTRWFRHSRVRQVTASPVSANRTYSSRRRRATGPTLPSPTGSPSILMTG